MIICRYLETQTIPLSIFVGGNLVETLLLNLRKKPLSLIFINSSLIKTYYKLRIIEKSHVMMETYQLLLQEE